MKDNKNYIVVDFEPSSTKAWNGFIDVLKKETKEDWELYGTRIKNEKFHSIGRYIHYFVLSWKLFLQRDRITNIIAVQQFYGLIFAFYCRLFHVKKITNVMVLSFIYNSKGGIVGKIYRKFIRFIVSGKYVDKLIVHSEHEVSYYSEILGIDESKLEFCLLGITNDTDKYQTKKLEELENFFILSVGNSNRDFDFIEECLRGEEYPVKIYSDNVEESVNKNIFYSKGISVSQYYEQLANCFCMVIALRDQNISSGQLVLLQSYAFGKPVIITRTKGCEDYIDESCVITINKNKKELLQMIKLLQEDREKYNMLCNNAVTIFQQKFSLEAMGRRLVKVLLD